MKKFTMILTILFSASLFAQTVAEEPSLENATEQYLYCLQHENDGVVEATLGNVVRLKLVHESSETEEIIAELENLIKNGETETVRYKAFLASQFLKNPVLLDRISNANDTDDEFFFKLMATELQEQLLTSR